MQYTRNEQDFARGTFRVRGDTIDMFPAENAANWPSASSCSTTRSSRCSCSSPLTGRIRQKMPRFTVYRQAHRGTRATGAGRRSKPSSIELDGRLKELLADGKLVEAQRLEQRTRFDLEMLREIGHCKGIENYSRHLSGARARRAAAHADRLPAAGRADVPRREPSR